jgi:hypothetical protein
MGVASAYEIFLYIRKTKEHHNTEENYFKRNFLKTSSLGTYELKPVHPRMLLDTS